MSTFEACLKHDAEKLQLLIQENNNVNQIDSQGRTALHYCSEHEKIDCANILLNTDATILNHQDNEGYSALHLACMNGNVNMVKYFCEQGANVNLTDNEHHSVIHWITVCRHIDLFDILNAYKAPLHTSDIYGAFPIHYASQLCVNGDSKNGLNCNIGLLVLKKLIEYNIDVNCLDVQERTPFIWAASAGATDALRILYKAGANPFHTDKELLSALHCAATRGHNSCIRLLVDLYHCPIEGEDMNGCTPLFYAITFNHLNVCEILLELKANPNHRDNRGRTPSHCAALKGNIDCLKLLVKYNANIWMKEKHGDYPIHEAINSIKKDDYDTGHFDIVRYIIQLYPDKIDIKNDENRTSLHLAAGFGNIEMCKLLIECGAKINSFIQTARGNYLTPYDIARIRQQDSCAEYLLENYGGQRGNLLANIFVRRIQKNYRRYKIQRNSLANQEKPVYNKLLIQAQTCLDNKVIEDRLKYMRISLNRRLSSTVNEKENSAQQRRQCFAKSKSTFLAMPRSDDEQKSSTDKIIIHTSNSVATSVKLYERHKLIAEELHKIKHAKIHDENIVIHRSLYKILIENAYNPQGRSIEEIEKYLETLMKAYETELGAIRKRTNSLSVRRTSNIC